MLLSIPIGIDPNLFTFGSFTLTWHGFFTFVAVAVVVWLCAKWGERAGVHPDIVYSVAVWAILGGVVGARAVHVLDRWTDYYQYNMLDVFYIWKLGGIGVWGAVLGAFTGVAIYSRFNKYPLGLFADIAAPAAMIGMAIGRIGDIINGEHIGVSTSMPWGFVYSHPSSPTNFYFGLTPTHPAVVYELILDLFIAWVAFKLQKRLRPYGMSFAALLVMYSIARFFVSFYRLRGGPAGEKIWFQGMSEAQVISVIIMVVAGAFLVFRAQWLRRPRPLQMSAAPTRLPSDEPPAASGKEPAAKGNDKS